MEPFDGGKFEREWSAAFEGAEITPVAATWDGIDAQLSGQEGVLFRKRYANMRWVAAAAILLTILSSGLMYYFWDSNRQLSNQLALQQNQPIENSIALQDSEANATSELNNLSNQQKEEQAFSSPEDNTLSNTSVADNSISETDNLNSNYGFSLDEQPQKEGTTSELDKPIIVGDESFSTLESLGLTSMAGFKEGDMKRQHMIDLDFSVEEDNFERKMWAGLNMSGGAYNPEATTGISLSFASAAEDFSADQSSTSESTIKGNTRGYGLGVGANLSERLLLKSGVQYAAVTSGTYLGSDPNVAAASISSTRSNFSASAVSNSAFTVDTYNFISIPIEAGYYLFNGKFSLSVNPGIDSRIYVNSNSTRYISGNVTANELEKDLNPLTIWGQLSTDISYRISDKYQVVVSPGYKISLNSFEKNSSLHPALKEVSFSMRYLFDN